MTEQEIYLEIWNYLTPLFPDTPIVQGLQNNSPLPKNSIVMTLMPFAQDLDQSRYDWDGNTEEGQIQTSRQQMMQLDFYGDDAYNKSMKLSLLWRSTYTTNALTNLQPLFANNPRALEYVNEQDQYEKRFLLEIALQYNPYYAYAEQSTTSAAIDINLANS